MTYLPLTEIAHQWIKQRSALLTRSSHQIKSKMVAIDATAGNGHDTVFLADLIGKDGIVHAFDVQELALIKTRELLNQTPRLAEVNLHLASHADWSSYVPTIEHSSIRVAMMNLGYLPGSDKTVTTTAKHSVSFIREIAIHLQPEGLLTVLAYRGHPGGQEEFQAVEQTIENLDKMIFTVDRFPVESRPQSPILFCIQRISGIMLPNSLQ